MLAELKKLTAGLIAPQLQLSEAELVSMFESPKQPGRGQLALPLFAFAKSMKKNPKDLAVEWASLWDSGKPSEIEKIEAVSGFVNFTFAPRFTQLVLSRSVFENSSAVGFGTKGNGKTLLIDFSSPNVAKPMHIGHLRATVIGQAIVNLARSQGYKVLGLNHLGDWGVQFGRLAWAYMQWKDEYPFESEPFESLYKIYVRFHEELEKNPDLEIQGSQMFKRLEAGDSEVKRLWQQFVDISLKDYQRLWNMLGVQHDLVRGESFYNDRMVAVESRLMQKGLLEESDGAMVVRLDDEGMPPCLIRKSDGASLYATRDLASAIYRMEELEADVNLYVVGVDQTLHFRQVFKVLEKMGYSWAKDCHHIAFGMYRFKDSRISTRKGNAIFLEDVFRHAIQSVRKIINSKNPDLQDAERVASQVGIGAVIFNDLVNDRVKDVDFDWDRALNFEGDSGPYVQYCGVRCASLARKFGKPIAQQFTADLSSPEEVELIRLLLNYQGVLESAFQSFKPHILAGYLLDVCHRFNQFYNKCRILGETEETAANRMTLVEATRRILLSGLGMLSIELPEMM